MPTLSNGDSQYQQALCCYEVVARETFTRKVRTPWITTLTKQQFRSLKQIYKDYGLEVPGWLRQKKLVLNQRRAALIKKVLQEAQLDDCWCGTIAGDDTDWSDALHLLWHLLMLGKPA